MYRPKVTNTTEKPRQARMQVRQPPHQSMAPYRRPAATRDTRTDVDAISLRLLSFRVLLSVWRRQPPRSYAPCQPVEPLEAEAPRDPRRGLQRAGAARRRRPPVGTAG